MNFSKFSGNFLKFSGNLIWRSMEFLKVTFAPNLAKKLSSIFYYLIILFQLSVANPENFKEFKAREVLKIRKEKTGILPTSLVRYHNGGKKQIAPSLHFVPKFYKLSAYAARALPCFYSIFKV